MPPICLRDWRWSLRVVARISKSKWVLGPPLDPGSVGKIDQISTRRLIGHRWLLGDGQNYIAARRNGWRVSALFFP